MCSATPGRRWRIQKGMSLAAVQKILGHDRLTTTAIYLNLTAGHVLEEFEAKW